MMAAPQTSLSPSRVSQRLIKNPDTQLWSKEPEHLSDHHASLTPRRRGMPQRDGTMLTANDTAQQVHSPSALEYFLSTSPRQQTKSLKQLLNTMDYVATKKLSNELELFEREHNLPMDEEDDDDDFVHSQRPMGTRSKQSRGSILFELNNPAASAAASRLPSMKAASTSGATALVSEVSGVNNVLSSSGNDQQQAMMQRSSTPPPPPPQEYLPGKRVPVVSTNPITGILCNVPLHRVFSVYREQFVRSARNRRSSQVLALGVSAASIATSKKEPLRLTIEDFMAMLQALLPAETAECVSREYARRMIEPFGAPTPYGGPPKVSFPVVFSYLCKCFGHPMVEKNVRFLMKCLDPKSKGGIPYAVLTGRVVRAWAENRVIGGAIHAWRALAAALEEAGDVDVRLLENPALIARDEVRMVSYTTQGLMDAMLLDLECDVTTAPRFPSLPSQGGSTSKGSDDASSVSGGRRADHHRSRTLL